MKSLTLYANQCQSLLRNLGVPIKDVNTWRVSNRMTRCYGKCKQSYDGYIITISSSLLSDTADSFALENTIIHELLHTINMGDRHGGEWAKWANYVSDNTKYKIERVNDYTEYGVHLPKTATKRKVRWKVVCDNCNCCAEYKRATEVIKHPEWFRCGICGSKLTIKNLEC